MTQPIPAVPQPRPVSAAATVTAAAEPPASGPTPLQARLQTAVDNLKPILGQDAEITAHRLAAVAGPGGQSVQVKATTYQPKSTAAAKALAVGKAAAYAIFLTPFALLSKSVRDTVKETWAGGPETTVYSAALAPEERKSLATVVKESRLLPDAFNQGKYSVNTQEGRAAFAKERFESPQHKREFTVVEGSGMYWIDNKNSRIVFVPEGRFGEPDFNNTRSFVVTDTKTGKRITDKTKLARTAYQFTISYNDYLTALPEAKKKGLSRLLSDARINRDLDARMEKLASLVGYARIVDLNKKRMAEIDTTLNNTQTPPSKEDSKTLNTEKERLTELNQRLEKKERTLNQATSFAPGSERASKTAIWERFQQGDVAFLTEKLRVEINEKHGADQTRIDDLTAQLQEAKTQLQKLVDGRFCNYQIDAIGIPVLVDKEQSLQIMPASIFKLVVDGNGKLTTTSAELDAHLKSANAPLSGVTLDPSEKRRLEETLRHVKGYEEASAKIPALKTAFELDTTNAENQNKLHTAQLEAGHHLEELFHTTVLAKFNVHQANAAQPAAAAQAAQPAVITKDTTTGQPLIDTQHAYEQTLARGAFGLQVEADGRLKTTSAELEQHLQGLTDPNLQLDPVIQLSAEEQAGLRTMIGHLKDYEAACAKINQVRDNQTLSQLDTTTQQQIATEAQKATQALQALFYSTDTPAANVANQPSVRDTNNETLHTAQELTQAITTLFEADQTPLLAQLRSTEQQKMLRQEAINAYTPRQIIIDPKEKTLRVASVYLKADPDTGELRPSANLNDGSVGLTLKMSKEWKKKFEASYTESMEKTFTSGPLDPTKILPPAAPPKKKPNLGGKKTPLSNLLP